MGKVEREKRIEKEREKEGERKGERESKGEKEREGERERERERGERERALSLSIPQHKGLNQGARRPVKSLAVMF